MMRRITGIEISEDYVKLIEVFYSRDGKVNLSKIYESPLPPTKDDGEIAQALKNIVGESRIKGRKVFLAIPEDQVVSRILDLPPMPEKDVKKIVLDELSTFKIFQEDYPVIELFKLEEKGDNIRYLVIGSPRKYLVRWIKILRQAGLQLKGVDLSPLSAFRALKNLRQDILTEKNFAFIYAGDKNTTIFFVKDGELVFLREFSSGIKDMQQKDEELNNWLGEVSGTLAYFLREGRGEISQFYVSGSTNTGYNYSELVRNLQTRLNLKVDLMSPFLNLDLPQDFAYLIENGSSYSSLIGLTLQEYENTFKVNLIPQDVREYKKDLFRFIFASLAILGIGFTAISLSLYLSTFRIDSINSIKEIKENLAIVEKSITDMAFIEVDFNKIRLEEERWSKIQNQFSQINLYKGILIILNSSGDKVKIADINYAEGDTIYLSVTTFEFSPVFSYRDSLAESGVFNDVRILNFEKSDRGILSQIKVEVKKDGN